MSKLPIIFGKNNVFILKQIVQGTQNGIGILVGQAVFNYGSKHSKFWFDQ